MDADRWSLVKDRFSEALGLPLAERRRFLHHLDDATRSEVVALLEAAEPTSGPLDLPFDLSLLGIDLPGATAGGGAGEEHPLADTQVGPYLIEEKIGQGGMGDVYRARRADGLFERVVALKLVRADTETVLARFAAERRILGTLEHPGIARLIAAGSETEGPTAGRPWLALEYVDGVPLTEAVRDLGLRDRLRLVAEIAEAVHHAHRRLVVHRDLKPSNVLVVEREDGTRRVKLLDFGIAKIVDPEADPGLTKIDGRSPRTRAYAAPEQVAGQPVTTATDVYGLGLLLFEVLTAARPFPIDQGLHALETAILHDDPPRPSATTQPDTGGLDPKRLHGDLDAICLKALAKEPEARYTSAEAFAADLHRYLAGEPVEARAPSVGYRARRFVKRHKVGVAATILVVIAIAVGTAATLWQARQAEKAATESAATAAFLSDLFKGADPTASSSDTLSALDLLDRGARRLDLELSDQPGVRANLYLVVGEAYLGLGRADSAQAFARRAAAVRAPEGAAPDPERAIQAQLLLGRSLGPSEPTRATQLLVSAVADARALGNDAVLLDALEAQGTMGSRATLEPAQAFTILEEAVALARRVEGDQSPRVGRLLYALSLPAPQAGQHGQVQNLLRDALARQPAEIVPYERSLTLLQLAGVDRVFGRLDVAEARLEEALALRLRLLGPDDPRTGQVLNELARLNAVNGNPEEAERQAREALRIAQESGHAGLIHEAYSALSSALHWLSRHSESVEVRREQIAHARTAFGEESPAYTGVLTGLALELGLANRPDEAFNAWDEAIQRYNSLYGTTSAITVAILVQAGNSAYRAGRLNRAEAYFTEAFASSRDLPETSRLKAASALRLGWVYLDQGRADEAVVPLRAAAAARDRLNTYGHVTQPEATSDGDRAVALLGEALVATGDTTEGVRLIEDAVPALTDSLRADHRDVLRARAVLDRARSK